MTAQQGTFSIPTRLMLTAEQRAKLDTLVRSEQADVAEVVSHILGEFLDTLPTPAPTAAGAPDRRNEIRQRRAELARLRARRQAAGADAPAWLSAYIGDIEAELRRLEA